MDLLAFGNTGWGDELFFATLMTVAVSITAMIIGFCFPQFLKVKICPESSFFPEDPTCRDSG